MATTTGVAWHQGVIVGKKSLVASIVAVILGAAACTSPPISGPRLNTFIVYRFQTTVRVYFEVGWNTSSGTCTYSLDGGPSQPTSCGVATVTVPASAATHTIKVFATPPVGPAASASFTFVGENPPVAGVVRTTSGTPGLAGDRDSDPYPTTVGGLFDGPTGIAISKFFLDFLYVADRDNDLLRIVTSPGPIAPTTTWGGQSGIATETDEDEGTLTPPCTNCIQNGDPRDATFDHPAAIANSADGEDLYIADAGGDTIRHIDLRLYNTSTLAGSPEAPGSADGAGPVARFDDPEGIVVDDAGNVYVADTGNDTIRKVLPDGTVTTVAGAAGQPGFADGPGADARFDHPVGLALDADGNVIIADAGNDAIRRLTPSGQVTTIAGVPGQAGSSDGGATMARFDSPHGVTVDPRGTIFVTDTGNDTIRAIATDGSVSTVAGSPGVVGSADGTGPAASFDAPTGIVEGTSGILYVADTGNDTIRAVS